MPGPGPDYSHSAVGFGLVGVESYILVGGKHPSVLSTVAGTGWD